ncbi:MAG: hypothetical protein DUD39_02565 [Coriobacteriaceae bacterium]|nr:MAG: hypothetical protein DUD39_02565 [Coriobacteriaceae bacterium]
MYTRGALVDMPQPLWDWWKTRVDVNGGLTERSEKGFDDRKYYESTAQDGWPKKYEAATDQTVIDFGNVTALQAGFVE